MDSTFVASTTPGGRPPASLSAAPKRRSLSPPLPYSFEVSMKLNGLFSTLRSVANAWSAPTS